MRVFLILAINIFLFSTALRAEEPLFPRENGEKRNFQLTVEFNQAYLQGMMIVKRVGSEMVCTCINEFGIKAFDFRYNLEREKGRMQDVIKFLNKWYIKRIIRKDLCRIFENMERLEQKDGVVDLSGLELSVKYTMKTFN